MKDPMSLPKPFTCDICLKCFSQRGSLRAHSLTHKAKSFTCSECGASFADRSNFKRHCRHLHKMYTIASSSEAQSTNHQVPPPHHQLAQLNSSQPSVAELEQEIQEQVRQQVQIQVAAILQQQQNQNQQDQQLQLELQLQQSRSQSQCHVGSDSEVQPNQKQQQSDEVEAQQNLLIHHQPATLYEPPRSEGMKPEKEDQVFECIHCSLQLLSETDHLQHVASVHLTEGDLRCTTCGETSDSRFHLVTHVLMHSGVEPHVCSICCRAFGNKHSLSRHFEQLHAGEPIRPLLTTMSPVEVCVQTSVCEAEEEQCQHCGLKFIGKVELHSHKSSVHSDTPHVHRCGQCAGVFLTVEALAAHQSRHAPSQFICTECDKKFTWKSALTTHMKRHRGLTFVCDLCGKGFSRKSTLQVHERLHSGSKPFQCTICPKRFTQKTHLSLHMRHHEGTRSHVCDVCGRAFIEKGNMKRHKVLVHHMSKESKSIITTPVSNETPSCPVPTVTSNMQEYHTKVGEGVVQVGEKRMFPCDECGRVFGDKGNMKRHQKLVHGRKQESDQEKSSRGCYPCQLCGCVFDHRQKILRHVKCVHPEQSPSCDNDIPTNIHNHSDGTHCDLTCDVCGKVLDSDISMVQHRSMMHPELYHLYNVNSDEQARLTHCHPHASQLSQYLPPHR